MNQTPDELWLAFKALAKTYPHDDGVRLTQDLARWLVEERQRLQIPIPPLLQSVVQTNEHAKSGEHSRGPLKIRKSKHGNDK